MQCATETRHQFELKVPKARLKLKLMKGFQPRANLPYVFEVEEQRLEGETSGEGLIDIEVPATATTGSLLLRDGDSEEQHTIRIGHLDPDGATTGVQARLNNLGFSAGAVDGDEGERTRAAIAAFQVSQDLSVTGVVDADVRAKLKELHGS